MKCKIDTALNISAPDILKQITTTARRKYDMLPRAATPSIIDKKQAENKIISNIAIPFG